MNNCSVCKNPMEARSIWLKEPIDKKDLYCPYCEWKGTAGPGSQLRDYVREPVKL